MTRAVFQLDVSFVPSNIRHKIMRSRPGTELDIMYITYAIPACV